MSNRPKPGEYDAWYHQPCGAWVGEQEAAALLRMVDIGSQTSLLDVGCGSGWFTRCFAATGCSVVGLDPDRAMLDYAHNQDNRIHYVQGDMRRLPLADNSVDVVTAITSLCFVRDEHQALAEMLRVARKTVLLGLLHRQSFWYWLRAGRGSYTGARWHTRKDIESLLRNFQVLRAVEIETLLLWPGNPGTGRVLERLPWLAKRFGGFMAVKLSL
jgi:SAM-dependent methyltransferase